MITHREYGLRRKWERRGVRQAWVGAGWGAKGREGAFESFWGLDPSRIRVPPSLIVQDALSFPRSQISVRVGTAEYVRGAASSPQGRGSRVQLEGQWEVPAFVWDL